MIESWTLSCSALWVSGSTSLLPLRVSCVRTPLVPRDLPLLMMGMANEWQLLTSLAFTLFFNTATQTIPTNYSWHFQSVVKTKTSCLFYLQPYMQDLADSNYAVTVEWMSKWESELSWLIYNVFKLRLVGCILFNRSHHFRDHLTKSLAVFLETHVSVSQPCVSCTLHRKEFPYY
jgi:hypothetical protein